MLSAHSSSISSPSTLLINPLCAISYSLPRLFHWTSLGCPVPVYVFLSVRLLNLNQLFVSMASLLFHTFSSPLIETLSEQLLLPDLLIILLLCQSNKVRKHWFNRIGKVAQGIRVPNGFDTLVKPVLFFLRLWGVFASSAQMIVWCLSCHLSHTTHHISPFFQWCKACSA